MPALAMMRPVARKHGCWLLSPELGLHCPALPAAQTCLYLCMAGSHQVLGDTQTHAHDSGRAVYSPASGEGRGRAEVQRTSVWPHDKKTMLSFKRSVRGWGL